MGDESKTPTTPAPSSGQLPTVLRPAQDWVENNVKGYLKDTTRDIGDTLEDLSNKQVTSQKVQKAIPYIGFLGVTIIGLLLIEPASNLFKGTGKLIGKIGGPFKYLGDGIGAVGEFLALGLTLATGYLAFKAFKREEVIPAAAKPAAGPSPVAAAGVAMGTVARTLMPGEVEAKVKTANDNAKAAREKLARAVNSPSGEAATEQQLREIEQALKDLHGQTDGATEFNRFKDAASKANGRVTKQQVEGFWENLEARCTELCMEGANARPGAMEKIGNKIVESNRLTRGIRNTYNWARGPKEWSLKNVRNMLAELRGGRAPATPMDALKLAAIETVDVVVRSAPAEAAAAHGTVPAQESVRPQEPASTEPPAGSSGESVHPAGAVDSARPAEPLKIDYGSAVPSGEPAATNPALPQADGTVVDPIGPPSPEPVSAPVAGRNWNRLNPIEWMKAGIRSARAGIDYVNNAHINTYNPPPPAESEPPVSPPVESGTTPPPNYNGEPTANTEGPPVAESTAAAPELASAPGVAPESPGPRSSGLGDYVDAVIKATPKGESPAPTAPDPVSVNPDYLGHALDGLNADGVPVPVGDSGTVPIPSETPAPRTASQQAADVGAVAEHVTADGAPSAPSNVPPAQPQQPHAPSGGEGQPPPMIPAEPPSIPENPFTPGQGNPIDNPTGNIVADVSASGTTSPPAEGTSSAPRQADTNGTSSANKTAVHDAALEALAPEPAAPNGIAPETTTSGGTGTARPAPQTSGAAAEPSAPPGTSSAPAEAPKGVRPRIKIGGFRPVLDALFLPTGIAPKTVTPLSVLGHGVVAYAAAVDGTHHVVENLEADRRARGLSPAGSGSNPNNGYLQNLWNTYAGEDGGKARTEVAKSVAPSYLNATAGVLLGGAPSRLWNAAFNLGSYKVQVDRLCQYMASDAMVLKTKEDTTVDMRPQLCEAINKILNLTGTPRELTPAKLGGSRLLAEEIKKWAHDHKIEGMETPDAPVGAIVKPFLTELRKTMGSDYPLEAFEREHHPEFFSRQLWKDAGSDFVSHWSGIGHNYKNEYQNRGQWFDGEVLSVGGMPVLVAGMPVPTKAPTAVRELGQYLAPEAPRLLIKADHTAPGDTVNEQRYPNLIREGVLMLMKIRTQQEQRADNITFEDLNNLENLKLVAERLNDEKKRLESNIAGWEWANSGFSANFSWLAMQEAIPQKQKDAHRQDLDKLERINAALDELKDFERVAQEKARINYEHKRADQKKTLKNLLDEGAPPKDIADFVKSHPGLLTKATQWRVYYNRIANDLKQHGLELVAAYNLNGGANPLDPERKTPKPSNNRWMVLRDLDNGHIYQLEGKLELKGLGFTVAGVTDLATGKHVELTTPVPMARYMNINSTPDAVQQFATAFDQVKKTQLQVSKKPAAPAPSPASVSPAPPLPTSPVGVATLPLVTQMSTTTLLAQAAGVLQPVVSSFVTQVAAAQNAQPPAPSTSAPPPTTQVKAPVSPPPSPVVAAKVPAPAAAAPVQTSSPKAGNDAPADSAANELSIGFNAAGYPAQPNQQLRGSELVFDKASVDASCSPPKETYHFTKGRKNLSVTGQRLNGCFVIEEINGEPVNKGKPNARILIELKDRDKDGNIGHIGRVLDNLFADREDPNLQGGMPSGRGYVYRADISKVPVYQRLIPKHTPSMPPQASAQNDMGLPVAFANLGSLSVALGAVNPLKSNSGGMGGGNI